jgi:hypothetical protein
VPEKRLPSFLKLAFSRPYIGLSADAERLLTATRLPLAVRPFVSHPLPERTSSVARKATLILLSIAALASAEIAQPLDRALKGGWILSKTPVGGFPSFVGTAASGHRMFGSTCQGKLICFKGK